MVTAFLGLGSNLGNRLALLQSGRDRLLACAGVTLARASAVYETAAEHCPPGSPPFLNAVLQIRTTLEPRELLELCQAVETALGRVRSEPNAPRTLDIDLLLYGDAIIAEPGLQVPHPRLHERAFVLVPLAAIAAAVMHPVLHQPIRVLAAALPCGSALLPQQPDW